MSSVVPEISTLKEQGNDALSKNAFFEAIKFYTDALAIDDTNYILYSNRAAAYAKLGEYEKALKDAEKSIALNPGWAKGYIRKASILASLDRLDEAITFYEEALRLDPKNTAIQDALIDCKKKKADSCGLPPNMPNPFALPDMYPKLLADPKTREYLNDPKFVKLLESLREDKERMRMNLHDPRVLACLGVLLGFCTVEDKDETMHVDPQEVEANPQRPVAGDGMPARKRVALEKKIRGNEFYKKRMFDLAMQEYIDALQLDPTDITFLLNIAAIYFEQKDYDLCIDQCEKAIYIGRENRADFKLIAKAFTRMGNAYKKLGNLKMAKVSFEKAMAEHRTPEIKTLISEVEQRMKEEERKAYIDPVKAEEEKEKGNEKFKEGDYATAVKFYCEAILRNPDEAKYYSNRAACYTKLGAFDLALKDCEKCVELDPKFVKGWVRKGKILQNMQQHPKALKAYQTALSLDPTNSEAMEGYRSCSVFYDSNPEEVRKRAMADPEVQAILRDPAMRLILEQMQNDPKALQDHLKNPAIAEKLQKLLESGLIAIH